MFNKVKKALKRKEQDLSKARDNRCVPVVEAMIKMIGEYDNLSMREIDQGELNKNYKDLVQEIKRLFLDNDIKLSDINYITQLCLKPIETIKYILNENFNHSLSAVQDNFWGKDNADVTIKDLNNKLIENEE